MTTDWEVLNQGAVAVEELNDHGLTDKEEEYFQSALAVVVLIVLCGVIVLVAVISNLVR